MSDLPLIKAAKLWARVSARTGATYLTGRWGGCRVLVFENLERASEAEPITEGGGLKDAQAQGQAIAQAKLPLDQAVEEATKAN